MARETVGERVGSDIQWRIAEWPGVLRSMARETVGERVGSESQWRIAEWPGVLTARASQRTAAKLRSRSIATPGRASRLGFDSFSRLLGGEGRRCAIAGAFEGRAP